VEAGRFAGYRDAGVNRVSMGIQALSDTDLRALGRLHTVAEAMAAFDTARTIFDRVSFDLIYARQDQTVEDWEGELRRALSLAVDHLSLYQLTVEEGTAFGDRFALGKLRGLPDEDRAADMYELTQAMTAEFGYGAYEVSNHARPGQESKHNLIYWRSGDYAGIGPGAHGRLTLAGQRMATEAPKAPMLWLEQVEQKGSGEGIREALTREARLAEAVMMGLRLNGGVDLHQIEHLASSSFHNNIKGLIDICMLEVVGGHLRTTPAGRPVLNAVLRQLLTD
jgi:putative oxygen-independent coproporphyrinogen III oxidase